MGNLFGCPQQDGSNEGYPNHIQFPVLLLIALGNFQHQFLGLEREHEAQKHPGDKNHDNHIGNHVYAPFAKTHINAGLLQGAFGRSIGRCADGRADTAQVGGHRDAQRQADFTLVVRGKLGKHRGEQGQHHGGGGGVGHEHGKHGNHDKEAQQHNLRLSAENLQQGAGQGDVQAVFLCHDGQHETAQEQHHHRVCHGSHDTAVRYQRAILRVTENADTLIGYRKQGNHNHQQRSGPVGDNFKNPHEGSKDKQGNYALLYNRQGLDAEERHGNSPQEYGNDQHQRQEYHIFSIELHNILILLFFVGETNIDRDVFQLQVHNVRLDGRGHHGVFVHELGGGFTVAHGLEFQDAGA